LKIEESGAIEKEESVVCASFVLFGGQNNGWVRNTRAHGNTHTLNIGLGRWPAGLFIVIQLQIYWSNLLFSRLLSAENTCCLVETPLNLLLLTVNNR